MYYIEKAYVWLLVRGHDQAKMKQIVLSVWLISTVWTLLSLYWFRRRSPYMIRWIAKQKCRMLWKCQACHNWSSWQTWSSLDGLHRSDITTRLFWIFQQWMPLMRRESYSPIVQSKSFIQLNWLIKSYILMQIMHYSRKGSVRKFSASGYLSGKCEFYAIGVEIEF